MSAEGRHKLFVGVPLHDGLRAELAAAVVRLRRATSTESDWRWTDPVDWHLTLAFVGWVAAAAGPRLAATLATVAADHPPFRVETGGLGTFPAGRSVRVVWYGANDPAGRLAALAGDVRAAIGAELDDPFHAHITLARARDRRGRAADPAWSSARLPVADLAVKRVILYRSHAGQGPAPHYESLVEVPLGAPLAAASA